MINTSHFLTPQHNFIKVGKKDRLIFYAVEKPTMGSIPIKLMTSMNDVTKLDCTFGMVMVNLLVYVWNL